MKNEKPPPVPPRWANQLMEWFCAPHLLEEIQGDLHERFQKRVKGWGEKEARRQYAWEVLGFLRPFTLKRDSKMYSTPNTTVMLQSYFIIALRSLRRNLSYALLNVFGLALGMAACLIIFLIVRNELGYDNFHQKADRTYRVTLNALDFNSNVSMAVVPAMRTDFPELEQATQIFYQSGGMVKIGKNRYSEKAYAFADQHFTSVFDYQWLAGNPKTALSEPNSVVLTESIARKYFGEKEALGQVINLSNQFDLKVTGLIKDVPANTHLPFLFLVSIETVKKELQGAMANFWAEVMPASSFPRTIPFSNSKGRYRPS